ncbi:MAG: hypothetical protein MUF48_08665 [Pirellulaceae bacterium]|jgi:hypothetical protein|nr:hypothetical protein [Pirellulaceae bacterium]
MATDGFQSTDEVLWEQFLHRVREMLQDRQRSRDESPLAVVTDEFFANNWAECRDGLLRRTKRLSVTPEPGPAPRVFRFEVDRPYKRKLAPGAAVELMPGPIRGAIHYRSDLFHNPGGLHVAVQVDAELAFFHPNASRRHGSLVCLGNLPTGLFPFPLDLLLETRLYPILSYQDRQPSQPFDLEAAAYFALDPHALDGLEPVEPLY